MCPFGRTVRATKAILVAAALSPLAGMSLAADEEPYPIWWSPELELESLDRIDERLERPFWPDNDGFDMFRREGIRVFSDLAPNCATLINLVEQGYHAKGSHNRRLQSFLLAECEALQFLKDALPAKRSYLRGLTLNREAFQFLPHMVDLGISCWSWCQTYFANEERHPMREPVVLKKLELISDHEMTFETELDHVEMEILVRADLNFDGFDDILLRSKAYVFDGTWGATDLFPLTRDAPESVLRVVNPDRYLCTHYQCDPADYYDRE